MRIVVFDASVCIELVVTVEHADSDESNIGLSGVDSVVLVLSIFSDSDSSFKILCRHFPHHQLFYENDLWKNMSIFGI